MRIKSFFLSGIIFFFTLNEVFSQDYPNEIYFHELIEQAVDPNLSRPLILKNTRILFLPQYNSKSKVFKYLRSKYGDKLFNENDQLVVTRDLVIRNCLFEGSVEFVDYYFVHSLNIYNSIMNELVLEGEFNVVNIEQNEAFNIRLLDSKFHYPVGLNFNETDYIKLDESEFQGTLSLISNIIKEDVKISKCIFLPASGFSCEILSDSLTYSRGFYYNLQLDFKGENGGPVVFEDNNFLADNSYQRVHLRGLMGELIMENNSFKSTLDLTGLSIENRFILANNTFDSYIAFNDLIFPEFFNLLRWEQFQGYKITVFEKVRSSNTDFWSALIECNPDVMVMPDKEDKMVIPYRGENNLELQNENAFEKLIYSYKSLYTIYNTRGDLESANACYAEMKEIQRRRLKYIYQNEGGFANYFRWQLLVLLKVYTNHGTDPALSMVISVYVIIIFAIFYFFFPSEWDVTSKSKLVSDFKLFIQKNDKGYIKPFLTVLLGFSLSMVNAFTLSLNSFVTLGFGNIPAKGLARYVCVLEGFIGWFLLSIFTVALINQVLA
ncbi:MAG: hypothetical protein OEW75_13530 [Cyclobacteriaceae bacterium]|nr:hypothetical protein [Cyclobacteriaceae bacterium]